MTHSPIPWVASHTSGRLLAVLPECVRRLLHEVLLEVFRFHCHELVSVEIGAIESSLLFYQIALVPSPTCQHFDDGYFTGVSWSSNYNSHDFHLVPGVNLWCAHCYRANRQSLSPVDEPVDNTASATLASNSHTLLAYFLDKFSIVVNMSVERPESRARANPAPQDVCLDPPWQDTADLVLHELASGNRKDVIKFLLQTL